MALLINQVVAEVQPAVTPEHQSQPPHAQSMVSAPEYEMVKMLSLIEERKARLMID